MAVFGGMTLTNKGLVLQGKAQAGTQLNYTRIAVGDGSLSGQAVPALNGLLSLKMNLPIARFRPQPPNKAVIGATLSNADITTGFYFREIGVFAQDPDIGEILYAYANAGVTADYIAAGGGSDIIEKAIDCVVIVGTAANITASIDDSLVFALQTDLDAVAAAKVDNEMGKGLSTNDYTTTEKNKLAGIATGAGGAGSATDTVIGNRTIVDTTAPTGDSGTLTNLLGWLANMIKSITGKSSWRTAPATTLEAAKTHADDTTRHLTAAERTAWNAKLNSSSVGNSNGNVPINNGTLNTNLNADMVDGLHEGNIMTLSSQSNTPSDLGTIIKSGVYRLPGSIVDGPSTSTLTAYGQMLVMHGANDTIAQLVAQYNTNNWFVRAGNPAAVGGSGSYKPWAMIWTEANDGSGSGLDADLLDGKHLNEVVQGSLSYAVTTGNSAALAVSITPAPAALSAGLRVSLKVHVAVSGPVTLNLNGLGDKSIKKSNGNDPTLALGGVYTVVYDGTAFILQGEGGEYGTATAAQVLTGYTVVTEAGLASGTIPDNRGVAKDAAGTVLDNAGNLFLNTPEGYYNTTSSIRSLENNLADPSNWRQDRTMFGRLGTMPVITSGSDPAIGVGKWADGGLAVYPSEGYRKGGPGAGEIKVSVAQLQSVNAYLAAEYIKSGAEIFGITGTLAPRMYASGSGTIGASVTTNFNSALTTVGSTNPATVSGLFFTPSYVKVQSGAYVALYIGALYGVDGICSLFGSTSANTETAFTTVVQRWNNSAALNVHSSGFTLPTGLSAGASFTWEAWG